LENEQIEMLEQCYFENDEPVPYKNFMIYPARVKDYYNFYKGLSCLTLEKNKDPNGITLSNLGYLFLKMDQEPDKHYNKRLEFIIEICLGIKPGVFCNKCGKEMHVEEIIEKLKDFSEIKNQKVWEKVYSKEILYCSDCQNARIDIITYGKDKKTQPYISIKGDIITKDDFNEIRKIICYQNIIGFDDSYIDPELEQDIKDRDKIINKNLSTPSLEKQKCCIIASGCNYDFETIKEITLRKFSLLLQTIDGKLHYEIYKDNEVSGAVTFPRGVNHWIYEKKKTKFDDMVLLDNIKQKLGSSSQISEEIV
jgi:hypothetical protein